MRYIVAFTLFGVGEVLLMKEEIIEVPTLGKCEEFTHSLWQGYTASFFSIALFASPLLDLNRVLSTRSTEGLSFSTTVLTTMLTTCWSVYGFLTENSSIILPNVLGLFLSLIQLTLFGLLSPNPGSKQIDV